MSEKIEDKVSEKMNPYVLRIKITKNQKAGLVKWAAGVPLEKCCRDELLNAARRDGIHFKP